MLQTPPPTHLALVLLLLVFFFFFFFVAVGCGVVVVAWVDRRWWVGGFVGISVQWLGSSASVGGLRGFHGGGCGCCRRSAINSHRHSPQTHAVDWSAYSWILGTWLGNPWSSPTYPFCRPSSSTLCLFVIDDFLFCLWLVILFGGLGRGKRLEIGVFCFFCFFFFLPVVDWWWWW